MKPYSSRVVAILVIALLALRLFSLGFPALTDPSEARYATIAQRMVTSGQWLVPEINRGEGFEPFWGKPPLHFWLTAISFKLFGFTEVAARLPAFLAGALTCWFVYLFGAVVSTRVGQLAALVLASSCTFLILSGASMTDMTLCACLTGAMVSFFKAVSKSSSTWGLAMFLALGLGMLVKGPIAIIFPGTSIFLWCLLSRRWHELAKLPWIGGLALFLLIVSPWFILAEQQSPGLNQYFFVNENFLRYLKTDYQDKYGSGHPVFRGAIWFFLFAGFLPWAILLPLKFRACKAFLSEIFRVRLEAVNDQSRLFLILWLIVPMLFFTAARSILFTYPLPVLPPLSLCTALVLLEVERTTPGRWLAKVIYSGIACSVLLLLSIVVGSSSISERLSTRELILQIATQAEVRTLYFLNKLPYSALFYGELQGGGIGMHVRTVESPFQPLASREALILSPKQAKEHSAELTKSKHQKPLGRWTVYTNVQ